jgi:hypothetical protein
MFVRFRSGKTRLQVSLLQTSRSDGKVRNEHVASLGSIKLPQTVDARITFWQRLHDRLAKLGNRVDATTQAKLCGDIHAKIPMVTLDEQRGLQLRNAEADKKFWTIMGSLNEGHLAGQQGIVRVAERSIADTKPAIKDAKTKEATAQNRIERLKQGEAISGGLGKPLTWEDFARAGLSASDVRRCLEAVELHELMGGTDDGDKMILDEVVKSQVRAIRTTQSRLLREARTRKKYGLDER